MDRKRVPDLRSTERSGTSEAAGNSNSRKRARKRSTPGYRPLNVERHRISADAKTTSAGEQRICLTNDV
jgi:hypothetical protein